MFEMLKEANQARSSVEASLKTVERQAEDQRKDYYNVTWDRALSVVRVLVDSVWRQPV